MQHFPLTEKLHTDILEEKYGLISTKVIKHNSKIREALLVDSKGVARTYALTFLNKLIDKDIKEINEEIKKEKAIGKAFREKGYTIRKNVLDVFIMKIPKWLQKEFSTKENNAKARLSEFYAKKQNSKPLIYGIVTEVYTPNFRRAIVNETDLLQIGAVTECLENQGLSKKEIYRRIGDDNNYEDIQKKYDLAKKQSKRIIEELRKRINKEIKTKD
jgi:hypothetical protein